MISCVNNLILYVSMLPQKMLDLEVLMGVVRSVNFQKTLSSLYFCPLDANTRLSGIQNCGQQVCALGGA